MAERMAQNGYEFEESGARESQVTFYCSPSSSLGGGGTSERSDGSN